MPMIKSSPSQSNRVRSSDAVERLYVYWLVSTALLILVVLIVVMLTRGMLRRQAAAVDELTGRVAALEDEISALRDDLGYVYDEPESTPQDAQPSREPILEPGGPPAAHQPELPDVGADRATPATETAAPADAMVQQALDRVVSDDPVTPLDVADPSEAGHVVETALLYAERARWGAATWARLAVLARLVGRDTAAEAFAERARAAGDPLLSYAEVSARSLLARGRPQEALPQARSLAAASRGAPRAQVLLAAAFMGTDDPASADEVVETLALPVVVPVYDKLVLAGVLMALEHWPQLEAVLSTVHDVPAELHAEHSFLVAVSLARAARTVEALAVLEGLLAETRPGPEAAVAGGWRWPRPDRHELEVWRGVTLMLAQQPEATRDVLQRAAGAAPDRADAHYYLGLLEARAGRGEIAKSHLKNALARAPRLTPALEALALLEIDEGQVPAALQHLSQAVAINFRRAPAHFLTAIAHAKLSEAEPAAAALRITFQLDERYLAEAKQTDVILKLFTPDELDRLAAESSLHELGSDAEGGAGR